MQSPPIAGIAAPLWGRAREAAELLKAHRERAGGPVTVVHHIDADGVTSGAVALEALKRAGMDAEPVAVRSLDQRHIEEVKERQPDLLWFCDLGSAAYMEFPHTPKIVCDHHQLVRDDTEEDFPHVNPLMDDLPGTDVSGAGATFLVDLALAPENVDLLPLALVGGSADLQDRDGGFAGTNAALLRHGQEAGLLHVERDIAWYGPEDRPVRKFLSLGREPQVPGVSGSRRTAEAFLRSAGVDLDGDEPTWNQLDADTRRRLRSRIVEQHLACGGDAADLDRLWRDVVTLPKEPPGSPTRELQSYGTLLNATARYDRAEVGLAVARGDRGEAYKEAMDLLGGHRKHLVGALDAFRERGIQVRPHLQWVHLEDTVRDTVVGIVCGMALEALELRKDLPLIGFAHAPADKTKVSSRAPRGLQAQGLDLSAAMRAGAEAVGGQGGGHKGAAGATIPRGTEEPFLDVVQKTLAGQRPLASA